MYQYKSDHNAVVDRPAWRHSWSLPLDGKVNGGLSVSGTTLYVETFGKSLYAVDVSTGRAKWRAPLVNISMNTPVIAQGVVITGSGTSDHLSDLPETPIMGRPEGDAIQAFDSETGANLWNLHTIGEDMPTGVYLLADRKPLFIVSNGDGHAYGVDVRNGSAVWRTPLPGSSWMSSMNYEGQLVFGSASDASLRFYNWVLASQRFDALRSHYYMFAIRSSDGQLVWTTPYGYADCSPTVGEGKVFSQDIRPVDKSNGWIVNNVYAVDSRTGNLLWKYTPPAGVFSGHGSSEGAVAALYRKGVLYQSFPWLREFAAIDARTGRILWRIGVHDPIKMSGVIKDGILYVGDGLGYFYSIQASSGKILRTIHFPSAFTCSPPVIVGQTLFVANSDRLYAIPLSDLEKESFHPSSVSS